MNYYSTRDHQQIVSAAQAIACGLAPDGGLFVPESLPEVSAQQLQALCGMTYQQRAVTIMRPFLSEFTDAELERFTAAAYGSQSQHNGTGAQHAARDLLFHLQILPLCVKLLVMGSQKPSPWLARRCSSTGGPFCFSRISGRLPFLKCSLILRF